MISKTLQILASIPLMLLVIGWHELGHLITGLMLGFRFELFVIGPLGIKREGDKIKVYFNKNISHYGGIAATTPVNDDPENARKLGLICLAGPVASIILSLIFGILYFMLQAPFQKFMLIGALGSAGIFLVTTIPSKTGMFFTDRKRYQRLTSDGPEKEVELALLRILGNWAKDNSYINVDINDLDKIISDDQYKYFGLFMKLSYQVEVNGQFESDTKEEYDEMSKTMSKAVVKASNIEIEKLIAKSNNSNQ